MEQSSRDKVEDSTSGHSDRKGRAMNQEGSTSVKQGSSTNPILILAFWLLVAIPLGWGFYNTWLQALLLFQ